MRGIGATLSGDEDVTISRRNINNRLAFFEPETSCRDSSDPVIASIEFDRAENLRRMSCRSVAKVAQG